MRLSFLPSICIHRSIILIFTEKKYACQFFFPWKIFCSAISIFISARILISATNSRLCYNYVFFFFIIFLFFSLLLLHFFFSNCHFLFLFSFCFLLFFLLLLFFFFFFFFYFFFFSSSSLSPPTTLALTILVRFLLDPSAISEQSHCSSDFAELLI